MQTLNAAHLTVSIQKSYRDTYAFLSDPRNIPKWATGLAKSVEKRGGAWVVDLHVGGEADLRFCDFNDLGVVDHFFKLKSGGEIAVAMRCLKSGDGTEVTFAIFQSTHLDDAAFAIESQKAKKDIQNLKVYLESL